MHRRGGTHYYIYILSSISRVIYVGFTDCLVKRIGQHRKGFYVNSFTEKYKVHKLVYWDNFNTKQAALARERQIKSYRRAKKVALIEQYNPQWNDMYSFLIEMSKRRPVI